MRNKKMLVGIITLALMIMLSACGSSSNQNSSEKNTNTDQKSAKMDKNMNMSGMKMSGSAEVPKGLKVAQNPTFKVGSQAIVHGDHMEGMDGSTATIVAAFDTIAYTVTYTPTTGGVPVKNHKWVIQEEIKNAGTEPLKPGTKVTLEGNHMEGMKGTEATIDSAEHTTVYMIDYTPTTGGAKVTNHKWVTESELSAK